MNVAIRFILDFLNDLLQFRRILLVNYVPVYVMSLLQNLRINNSFKIKRKHGKHFENIILYTGWGITYKVPVYNW